MTSSKEQSPVLRKGEGRSVPEWRSDNPDAKVPPHVRARIFDRHKGRCAISGRKIRPGEAWDLDHEKPLHLGGAHAEGNLRPVLTTEHRVKSAKEQRDKGKADRTRRKHLGLHVADQPMRKHPTLKRTISGRVVER